MVGSAAHSADSVNGAGVISIARATIVRSHVSRIAPHVAWRAVLLSVAYYVGARIGFFFRSPEAPQSILWLPNSILLATLLVAAPRRWPVYLAAALPAHLLAGWQGAAPLRALSLLFITNCTDAILGATLTRVAVRGRWRLDGLQNLVIFFVLGAALAPFLVSFGDAAITVLTGWGSSYWGAFAIRVRANTLTNVILVPTIVAGITAGTNGLLKQPSRRYVEGGVLFLGLIAISALIFSSPVDLGSLPALLYLPLPFLLWAAMRFGPGVTAAGLLAVALVSSWNAVRGVGAFSALRPAQNVLALQFFLLCVSVPLLCLAAVVQERQAASRALLRSQQALRSSLGHVASLAGKLVGAEEAERGRLARELHDDVSQQVAAIGISLSALTSAIAQRLSVEADVLTALQDRMHALHRSVRDLSHRLHPSIVTVAGLMPSIETLCSTFNGRESMAVTLLAGTLRPVSDTLALCVYRVVQEALQNAVTHAVATRVRVELGEDVGDLVLSISDDGRGFDATAVRGRTGLGLISMEERVRLLQGSIAIQSDSTGTRIAVRLPLREPSSS